MITQEVGTPCVPRPGEIYLFHFDLGEGIIDGWIVLMAIQKWSGAVVYRRDKSEWCWQCLVLAASNAIQPYLNSSPGEIQNGYWPLHKAARLV